MSEVVIVPKCGWCSRNAQADAACRLCKTPFELAFCDHHEGDAKTVMDAHTVRLHPELFKPEFFDKYLDEGRYRSQLDTLKLMQVSGKVSAQPFIDAVEARRRFREAKLVGVEIETKD
jgi:hypothetical protein